MSKRLYSQFSTLVLLSLSLGIIFLATGVGFSADTYSIPQTAEVTLAWDPNDPAPDGYRIYQRMEGNSYNYSEPSWTGPGNTGTVYNLKLDTTYYFVVRAFDGELESSDSEEVYFETPPPKPVTYSITASAGGNGTISPQGTITTAEGTDQTFTITPDTGCQTADVKVDGVSQGAIFSYTFSDISTNHKIDVTFTTDSNQNPDPDPDTGNGTGEELPLDSTTDDNLIVIDDGQNGTSAMGRWSISGAGDPYGSRSLYSKQVGATYSFESALTGSYEVSIWWSSYASRCTSVPVKIYDGADLLETVYVNQQENGGQWNFLDLYEFTGQARIEVVVEDSACSTSVDAVEFAKTTDIPEIIDDGQNGTSAMGRWSISGAGDPYGSQSLYSKQVGATYSFESALTGSYEVSIWWSSYASRCTSVPVKIYDGADLLETVYVNQQENGGQWNFLDLYEFTGQARIEVVVEDSACSTSVDAVEFAKTTDILEIIDDGQNGTSAMGRWSISGAGDPYGSQSLYSKQVGATYSFESALTPKQASIEL
jgi:hypothetical protein